MKLLNILAAMFAAVTLSACASYHTKNPSNLAPSAYNAPAPYQAPPVTGSRKVGSPYTILGKMYYPISSSEGFREKGIASWYGHPFHGRKTANGERYNMYSMTAAHPTLPLPTYVRVTNLKNGRSVMLRVNDRGPFKRGRAIDVSYRAAQLLDFAIDGTTPVLIEALPTDGSSLRVGQQPALQMASAEKKAPLYAGAGAGSSFTQRVSGKSNNANDNAPQPKQERFENHNAIVSRPRYFVQTGAYSSEGNALKERDNLLKLFSDVRLQNTRIDGLDVWRVRVGPAESVEQADSLLSKVMTNGWREAQIVVD